MAPNSALCKRCRVLQFDDKALGGHVITSTTGERYVKFGGSFAMSLGYSLRDTLPDLPILAAGQCGMCALMRERFLVIVK